jgi:hypothetical protein
LPLTDDDAQYCFQVGLSIKLTLIFFAKHLVPSTAEIPMVGDAGKMRTAEFFAQTAFLVFNAEQLGWLQVGQKCRVFQHPVK